MKTRHVQETLRQLAGHLVIENDEERRNLDVLYKALGDAGVPRGNRPVMQSDFSIAKADLFFDETIPKRRIQELDAVAARIDKRKDEARSLVFVREVPIRESLLHASVPSWAAGARVGQSVGPFTNKDGRQFWFDFYPIAKLTALYVQGIAEPALLFKEDPRRREGGADRQRVVAQFNLGKGSLWINARFLAAGAPAASYVGLTIDGGRIGLTAAPALQNGQLTAPANATVSVQLELAQAAVTNADPSSRYGADARELQLELPRSFAFHFSAHSHAIDAVGDTRWELYGQPLQFTRRQDAATYDVLLQRVLVPFDASDDTLRIDNCRSEFHTLRGAAGIARSAWALPIATIDITQPPEAQGTGGMLVQANEGLLDAWPALQGGGLHFAHPAFLISPGSILLADFTNGNPHATHTLRLWRDESNPFGSSVALTFPFPALFFYAADASGVELLMTFANADFRVDRPVKVNGEPPAVRSLNSLLMIAASPAARLIYLFDDNLLQDAITADKTKLPQPIALALTNALFKVTPPNGALLFGFLSDDYAKVESGFLFFTFGLFAYLPTLPDPYAANLGVLRRQVRGREFVRDATFSTLPATSISAWLVCRVRWQPPAAEDGNDEVAVSFHFAPLSNQFGGISLEDTESPEREEHIAEPVASPSSPVRVAGTAGLSQGTRNISRLNTEISNAIAVHNVNVGAARIAAVAAPTETAAAVSGTSHREPLPNYGERWDGATARLRQNIFALLDVSTNADLFGVSFDWLSGRRDQLLLTHVPVVPGVAAFPVQVQGMDVVTQGRNAKVFTLPMISWEPLLNLSEPHVQGDPPEGPNYYPNDGGPTQILNNGDETVTLAPLPLTGYLLEQFDQDVKDFAAYVLTTLPFGLKALALLQDPYTEIDANHQVKTRTGADVRLNAEAFEDDITGALQLQLNGGEAYIGGESNMFIGTTVQLNNVLDFFGISDGDSTLGRTVTTIFNNEFFHPSDLLGQRGVPLTRIDLTGYGATTFSNWLNPAAAFAQTSQARFDVLVGRCAHEIIQVKSIIYPWGIKVVRTITMFRVSSAYVYRHDSGWRAESNGEFDFRYWVNTDPDTKVEKPTPFKIHPGVIKGLFNVQNIIETDEIAPATGTMTSANFVNDDGIYVPNPAPGDALGFELQPVYFDADIEIENVVSGFATKKIGGVDKKVVPSKKILGYVHVAPMGIPITSEALKELIVVQLGSIGGPLNCEIDLAGSSQKMRVNRFDANNSFGTNGTDIEFAVAARGNVLLPKEGSWTLVKHARNTGEVSPVPANASVPVIRHGRLVAVGPGQQLDTPIQNALLRIADPADLLRLPAADTVNYGFVQNTDTQKALFLTPAFELGKKQLFSKTPPLFVDAFRIVNSKAIFPNIGNAETDLGDAISLITSGTEFGKGALQDIGKDVWSLMGLTGTAGNAAEQGYQLLKGAGTTFDLPNTEFELIDVGDGNFRIYIEYEQKDQNGNQQSKGSLDFNIDSMALDVADTWKSRMGNISLVVDLAGIDRLMSIKGNWDSKKGSGAAYPQPDLQFADELQPIIDILEILQQLQGGDYAGAVANGLKLAMSNKAGTWEYKFEASKEIPVLRFPVPDAVYNDPNCPFKLEAGLKIGAYFNAALMVTSNANELLPTAGGLLGFYGRLSVMCVSLSAATIYAIGQVNLDIAADTKIGPSLRMKFGFGAQIVVGLPVVGNVSVLFVVGVEIFAASGIIEVTAFLLFEGHAELLGGIVSITIRIEAKGTVSKKTIGGGDSRTDLMCQVTFGLDISIFLVINISFETSWSEQRQIA